MLDHICDSTEQLIEVIQLEKKKYSALMDLYNIHYKPHSTWFLQELKKEMPNLNATKVGTKNYVSLNTKTVQEAKGILKPYTLLENDGEGFGGNTRKTEE